MPLATIGKKGPDATPTWGVVMTVNEPLSLVLSNVHWHLTTGAQEVWVFLDDPQDAVAGPLSAVAGCHVVCCDAAYWVRQMRQIERPASQMRRQTVNANVARRQMGTDWLFHIDADEFIWQDRPLRQELAGGIAPQTEVNLPVLERLFPHDQVQARLFDGRFRATSDLTRAEARLAFGEYASFMKRGQYSHGAGKSGVRKDDGLRLGVHNATVRKGKRLARSAKHISQAARLLHFDGVTPLHWLLKVLRYSITAPDVQRSILQSHRMAQIDWMVERSETLDAARAAHATLFAGTPDRCSRLAQFGLLQDIPFHPERVVGPIWPDQSPEAFDADLLARNPWVTDLVIDEALNPGGSPV